MSFAVAQVKHTRIQRAACILLKITWIMSIADVIGLRSGPFLWVVLHTFRSCDELRATAQQQPHVGVTERTGA